MSTKSTRDIDRGDMADLSCTLPNRDVIAYLDEIDECKRVIALLVANGRAASHESHAATWDHALSKAIPLLEEELR